VAGRLKHAIARTLPAATLATGLTFSGAAYGGAQSQSQESTSRQKPASTPTTGAATTSSAAKPATSDAALAPATAALRDALSAACSQSQREFAKFLTTRNAETFSSLTAGARVAFMKRFVLLSEPGTPSVLVSGSGRPVVRCQTPDGTAELQIGGADSSDNLAFLPVEVRDATDAVGAGTMHVKMGMVRENGEWKLLSVGLVLLDLPSLAAEWDAAEMESTEQKAIEELKVIADAVEAYRRKYSRLPDSLDKLAPPTRGIANADTSGMLDSESASGVKEGYTFRYVIAGASTLGAPAKFEIAATPQAYGRTGRRSFFRDSTGGVHAADRQGSVGSAVDPRID
jgi:hypothetical protein